FYIKHVGAKAIFLAACISQAVVFLLFGLDVMPFLWLNFVGAAMTSLLAVILQQIYKQTPKKI
ncbi:MAG: sodium:solute symporter, partial [Flavobacteriaceae bacterium]|nr:sodium:solute symporter [Flavobacteriaceae bacterium]